MAYTINSGKSEPPYVYQEYPRRMYKWDAKPCSAGSDEDRAASEAEGWSIDQVFAQPRVIDRPTLTTAEPDITEALAEAVDVVRRGRPKKVRT